MNYQTEPDEDMDDEGPAHEASESKAEKKAEKLPDPKKMQADIDQSRARRGPEVALWDTSRRYLMGDQNLSRERGRNLFASNNDRDGKQRNKTTTNQMLSPYRTFLGLLKAKQPTLEWHGGSAAYANLTRAMACQVASMYWWQQNRMRTRMRELARYLFTDALAAFHTYFDSNTKKVTTEVLPAYDVLFETFAVRIEESRWIAVRHVYSKDELVRCYPDHKAYINECSPLTVIDNRAQVPEGRLDVWDVYFRDGTGRHGILLKDRWLWEGETPGKVVPVSTIKCIDVPGYIYGISMASPLIDVQRRYNRYRNMQLDIADAHSSPVWLTSTQANVPKSMFTNAPDNVITFNLSGGKPERLQPGSPPQSLFEITGGSQGEIADVTGLYSSVMGKRTVGVTSGVGMQGLAEASAGQLSDLLDNISDAVAEQARVAMVYWQAYLPESETVEFLDESVGRVVTKELAGTDLLESPNVFVREGTLFTIDAENRDAKLLDLLAKGIGDPAKIERQLSFKIDDMSMTKKMVNLSHARDLLEACKQGLQIEIFPEDDLEAIKEVFLEYMQSPAYYEPTLRAQVAYNMTGNELAVQEYDRQREICEYIRDVVVNIQTFGQPVDAYLQASNSKVFPRTDPKPAEAMQAIAAGPRSAGAQQQMMGQDADMRMRANKIAQAGAAFDAMKGTPGIPGARG